MRVLQGNFDQSYGRFGVHGGHQCTAMATAALCVMRSVENLTDWTSLDVDRCLEMENRLWVDSVYKLKEEIKFVDKHLRPEELLDQRHLNEVSQVRN